ncbi:MAG TPA: MFS transporter [Gaiellaceae bacterium]|nr:MFS transporter [Gaiellaceae bacterium]
MSPQLVPLRKNRDFLLLQSGQVLSTIGSESTAIAYPLLVLGLTHSPAKAGVVGFARILPWALFGFVAGVAADRFPRKAMMLTSDIVRAALLASIVIAIALHHITFQQIAIVAFFEGTMYVFFNIAEVGALRSVVPAAQLPTAAAAEQARFSTATIVAPPLGGALFGLSRAFPFLAGALSPAFSFATLLAMRTPFQEKREPDETPLREQIAEGFRFLWGHRFLRACALLFTFTNLVFEGMFLVLIVIGKRHGFSSGEIGGLIAIFGACSLAGSAIAPRIVHTLSMRTVVVGAFWIQFGMVAYVIWPSVWVLLGSYLPMALFLPSVYAVVIGYRVAITPDRLTGRVNSVARTIALCGAPLGPLGAGILLSTVSGRTTVTVFAAVLLALALSATLSPSIRKAPDLDELDELPPRPPAPLPELAGS